MLILLHLLMKRVWIIVHVVCCYSLSARVRASDRSEVCNDADEEEEEEDCVDCKDRILATNSCGNIFQSAPNSPPESRKCCQSRSQKAIASASLSAENCSW